jgi:hypothetical protein
MIRFLRARQMSCSSELGRARRRKFSAKDESETSNENAGQSYVPRDTVMWDWRLARVWLLAEISRLG